MTEKSVEITKDILFVAMTRTPMIMGVPYIAFVMELMFVSLSNIVLKNPLYMAAVIPVHAVFYVLSSHDAGIFSEIEMWSKTASRCLNRKFWGASSFSPLPVKKWKR
jgi:type IV secretion system protein VirB3